MENNLIVSEKFTSIQGEGQTMGKPSIFLRLAGCNLLCKSSSWVCDSIEVWKKGILTNFKDVFTPKEVQKLREGHHLIVTGGEPLLHQRRLHGFFTWFYEVYDFTPIIEVESNATIIPSTSFSTWVSYYNFSPKLETSGESLSKRFNSDLLKRASNWNNTIFKFVVSEERDITEIILMFLPFINQKQVTLMPDGDSKESLDKTRVFVAESAIKHGFNYSDRLHISIWNQKTGV